MARQDQKIAEAVSRERSRLRNYIRQRVPDPGDAEDVLQDVFEDLVEAYRLPEPIEQVGAWLYHVARNRIVDLFRKRKTEPLPSVAGQGEEDDDFRLDDLLPSPDAGPEAAYARGVLLEAIQSAVEDLPPEQRAVFIAHELEGRSFKELAEESGVSVNTLLSRKRYAVLQLRAQLQVIHDEYMNVSGETK